MAVISAEQSRTRLCNDTFNAARFLRLWSQGRHSLARTLHSSDKFRAAWSNADDGFRFRRTFEPGQATAVSCPTAPELVTTIRLWTGRSSTKHGFASCPATCVQRTIIADVTAASCCKAVAVAVSTA